MVPARELPPRPLTVVAVVGAKVARDAITPIDRILQPVSDFIVYRQIKLIDRSYMK